MRIALTHCAHVVRIPKRLCVSAGVALLLVLGLCGSAPALASVDFVGTWGSFGHDDGELSATYGVATNAAGDIYVMGSSNQRVQKFTSEGVFVTNWGSFGSNQGQFNIPRGIAVGPQGDVYVAEYGNNRIQKFDSDGAFLTTWGSEGSGNGEFDNPEGVAVDSSGNVYVADTFNHRVQKFTANGAFLTKWGYAGTGDGRFFFAHGIAIDASGYVYVSDDWNNRVQKFTSDGAFVTKWGSSYQNEGSGDGQFSNPRGIAVDSNGYVYVVDTDNHRVQQFTSAGTFVAKWGSKGSDDGQFETPRDVATDGSDTVYIADSLNYRIQEFRIASDPPPGPDPDEPPAAPSPSPSPTSPVSPGPGRPGAGDDSSLALELTGPRLKSTKTNRLSKKKLYRYLRRGFRGEAKGMTLSSKSFSASIVRTVRRRRRKGRVRCYTLMRKRTTCRKTRRRGFATRTEGGRTTFRYRPYSTRTVKKLRRLRRVRRGTYRLTVAASSAGATRTVTYKIRLR